MDATRYTLHVEARDKGGNEQVVASVAASSVVFTVDLAAPGAGITTPASGSIFTQTLFTTLAGTLSDPSSPENAGA